MESKGHRVFSWLTYWTCRVVAQPLQLLILGNHLPTSNSKKNLSIGFYYIKTLLPLGGWPSPTSTTNNPNLKSLPCCCSTPSAHQRRINSLYWGKMIPPKKLTKNPYPYWGIWMFPKIGVPQNGWFIMENPIKMDDMRVPLFKETPTYWFKKTKVL